MRERAQQSWPALPKTAEGAAAAARSRSASSKTRLADLPPSSSVTRLMVPAAPSMTLRPTSLQPALARRRADPAVAWLGGAGRAPMASRAAPGGAGEADLGDVGIPDQPLAA